VEAGKAGRSDLIEGSFEPAGASGLRHGTTRLQVIYGVSRDDRGHALPAPKARDKRAGPAPTITQDCHPQDLSNTLTFKATPRERPIKWLARAMRQPRSVPLRRFGACDPASALHRPQVIQAPAHCHSPVIPW